MTRPNVQRGMGAASSAAGMGPMGSQVTPPRLRRLLHMTRLQRLVLVLAVCLLGGAPAVTAAAATPKLPSISGVTPMKLGVGDTLTVRGKAFRAGTGRTTVVFKRNGGRAVFVKAGRATKTELSVKIPAKMLGALGQKSGKPTATRFRVRVLTSRFGRRYTGVKGSPVIGPVALSKTTTANDCDGDLVPNANDADDDNDLLSDTVEATLKTDPCRRDTDGDGMSDGWEHESALDYNGKAKPAPTRRPYPNALDAKDASVDADGDTMTNAQEYAAWATFGQDKLPLNYSGGEPATGGKAQAAAGREWADRDANGFLSDNERDADGDGLPNQEEDLIDGFPSVFTVAPRDANQRTLAVFSATHIAEPGVQDIVDFVPLYGVLAHTEKVLPLNWLDVDSDGDTVRDADDDQDGDGSSNLAELLAEIGAGAGGSFREGPINACEPSTDAPRCLVGDDDIDNDGEKNRRDDDDDGDGLTDAEERRYGLNQYRLDTDEDAIGDGYEFQAAIDLNSTAVPFPGKRPYPNPLDGKDAGEDYDGDGLTLSDEHAAWRFTGGAFPLSYSDGSLYTGGKGPAVAADDPRDTDGSGFLSDDERDVDADGLTNWDEAHGRMTPKWWEKTFTNFVSTNTGGGIDQIKESVYPGRKFLATSFVDTDTDGDSIPDGTDDEDHDGFSNRFEVERPADWATTYVSTTHSGGATPNPKARVNPFNPCKPYYSSTCHRYPPFDYYQDGEDWESPFRTDGP
ncbi:MAG: hypothetical protein JWO90_158 [Solirubrobacterales bacterium]|nr:hypothetical protein [Solirubrobacterales bacterium]